jgi:uncharacterized damage-inducible protein DinB
MRDYFEKMALNNAWANETLYAACLMMETPAIWSARPGYFGSIGRTLNHIYEVDLYYLDVLEQGGAARSVYQRDDERDLSNLATLQADVDFRLAQFCAGLTQETLVEMRDTVRRDEMVSERVDWLLLHLIQHQVHHRGQVHGMLSHAGVAPPQLDDFYLEHGRVPSAKVYWE